VWYNGKMTRNYTNKTSIEARVLRARRSGINLEHLREDKEASLKKMAEMGLPMSRRCTALIAEVVENPNQYLDQLESDIVVCTLIPTDPMQKRIRRSGLKREEVPGYLLGHLSSGSATERDKVILSRYSEVAVSGMLVVSQNGKKMLAELAQGGLVKVKNDKMGSRSVKDLNGTPPDEWRWSLDDKQLRAAMTEAVQCIPHTNGRISYGDQETTDRNGMYIKHQGERLQYESGPHYQPGYYEVMITVQQNGDDKIYQPIFNDYKDIDAYAVIPELENRSKS